MLTEVKTSEKVVVEFQNANTCGLPLGSFCKVLQENLTQAKVNKSAKMEGDIALLRENKLTKSQIWSPKELKKSTTIIRQTECFLNLFQEPYLKNFLPGKRAIPRRKII